MINAVIGFIGVIVGFLLTFLKDWLKERSGRKNRARYLAIRVVCNLDEFLQQCIDVAYDDGLYRGDYNADGNREAQISQPDDFSLPEDVDWHSIDHTLMYRILSLSNRVTASNRIIESAEDNSFPPDWDEAFEERQYQYSCLGLDVADLAKTLRLTYGIPEQKFRDWDPLQKLRDTKALVEGRRKIASPPLLYE